jgi:hypothetical protein
VLAVICLFFQGHTHLLRSAASVAGDQAPAGHPEGGGEPAEAAGAQGEDDGGQEGGEGHQRGLVMRVEWMHRAYAVGARAAMSS